MTELLWVVDEAPRAAAWCGQWRFNRRGRGGRLPSDTAGPGRVA